MTSIKDLVQRYHKNRNNYLKSDYNEAQLRTDFLDPLFELLGWDIKNQKGKPTNEREVLVEESFRSDTNSNTKKPDYTFRFFSERKFFLEAKKPYVKIESDPESAKQLRRYGFTAKLKISVLTNFEYLAIYDCSQKLDKNDSALKGLVRIYHYTEYENVFEEIQSQLSHDSVYSGEFDKNWEYIESQLKLSSVDDLFLKQINEWRLLLGNQIFSHHKKLSEDQLNDIVQSYINSIIFLRVCEDRNIEDYKTLLKFADNDDFDALIEKFRESDKKYNAGLFKNILIEEIISNNTSSFWIIIKQLYFPESIYSFSVFASDILGRIYEIFLSEHLKIINGQVFLKKKPENIDRDIVTTPTFIVQDILRETVQKYCEGKTDLEILNSSFADIACGSGAFLLEAYQMLHDILVDYYLKNNPAELIQTSISSYKLKFETKRKVLTNCIFGVDKDYSAVQACKFGLLLKLLEDEEGGTISTPALPCIDANIRFGNSLLEVDQISDESYDFINPYSFGDTKFDVIVGNPPYMTTEHMKQFTPLELTLYKDKYQSAYKQFDKYYLFIEKALYLLNSQGILGYIVPSKFVKTASGRKLRRLLTLSSSVHQIISFGANQVFENKTTYTCLLFLKKDKQQHIKYLEVQSLNKWKSKDVESYKYDFIKTEKLDEFGWLLVPGNLKSIFESIQNQSKSLESLIGLDNIYNGIQTSANSIYIHKLLNEDENFYYFSKDNINWKIEKELTRPYFKTSKGSDALDTYRPFVPNSFIIYPYLKTDKGIKCIEIEKLKSDYPNAYAYLNNYKKVLADPKRDVKPIPKTSNEWYRYGRHQSLEKCDVPAKIIVGVLSQGNKYAIDYYQTLISSGGTAGYCMITLPESFPYSIYYIQALLNSKYLEWFSALFGEIFRGGYIARGTKVLKKLPIRVINFENNEDRVLHDKIVEIQKNLIQLQSLIDQNIGNERLQIPIKRQYINKKHELDGVLKSLYALGDDDDLIPLISELYATH